LFCIYTIEAANTRIPIRKCLHQKESKTI